MCILKYFAIILT